MKLLVMALLGLSVSNAFADRPCLRTVVKERSECEDKKHPLAGAGIGWLVLGPLGALAGAAIGSDPDHECKTITETTCLEYAPIKTPKPKASADQ